MQVEVNPYKITMHHTDINHSRVKLLTSLLGASRTSVKKTSKIPSIKNRKIEGITCHMSLESD